MNVPAERLKRQIAAILAAWGFEDEAVRIAAEVMVHTDLAGVDSHGVAVLGMYDELRTMGLLNVRARPKVVRETPTTALIDADGGLGHPASVMGMELAIRKAGSAGMGAVSVVHSGHFGAAGYYAGLAPRRNMIGLATTTTRMVTVVPTRSSVPVLGTNPIAFAAPAKRNRPFLLDMSTSTTAVNKIRIMALEGRPLPAGWVVDRQGRPVTDASAAFECASRSENGGITPLGGTPEMASHKGYGLAMMVQILAGTLAGASFSPLREQSPGGPPNIGHFFLAIDPRAFRTDDGFEEDLDAAIDYLRGVEPVDPGKPVLVAGDPESASGAERGAQGVPVPDALADRIEAICRRCGAAFVLKG